MTMKRVSGFAIKRIAVVSMIIDHAGSILVKAMLTPYMQNGGVVFSADMPFLVRWSPYITYLCDALGRVAFPLFCFLLVEGFAHTRDRKKYLLRLALFALISEIPFDLAHGGLWHFSLQNVLFTLAVGFGTLWALETALHRLAGKRPARIAAGAAVTLAGMGLAYLLRAEYVFLGVLTMVLLYLLRDKEWFRLLGFAPLLIVSPWILLALIPVALYSGQRGKGSKYFFYVFYPAHFLVLTGIAYLIAG